MALATNKPASFSAEEIKAWEEEDKFKRKIRMVKFTDEERDVTSEFWVITPDRDTLFNITDMRSKKSTKDINDLTINKLVLAGDFATLEWNDTIYYDVSKEVASELNKAKKE